MDYQGNYGYVSISAADSFQRGCQYGEQLKDKIQSRVSMRFERGQLGGWDRDLALVNAMKFWPYFEGYSPNISQEIRGIAHGSGSKLEEIVMLNSSGPLAVYREKGRPFGGCTSFAVSGDATVEGKTYVGQNDDMWAGDSEFATVLKIESATTTILGFAFAGELPRKGVNSHGIALCVNALYDGRAKPGVPGTIITRDVLQQETIGGALYSIMRADRAFSANMVIGDKNGELYDVETTMDDYAIIYGQDALVHANHFVANRIVQQDFGVTDGPCSIVRYNRLKKLIDKNFGNIDEDWLKGFLADHVNYPDSICQHDSGHAPDDSANERFSTVGSIIIKPEDGVLLLAEGNPCKNPFLELRIQG